MKATHAEQQALVVLLNRIYGEILAIEKEWDIRLEAKDYRPRIEYFHDAIRALTSGHVEKGRGRLSVEFLAYDVSMLRHIQANPFPKNKDTKKTLSASTQLVVRAQPEGPASRAGSSVKSQLADLYKNYSVLFVALLSDAAERNYYDRTGQGNSEVEDIATLEQAVASAAKKAEEVDITALAEQAIEDPDLLNKVLFYIHNNKQRKRMLAQEALRKIKELSSSIDKDIQSVEKAHFTYVTSQLAIYESARDVVKKMATQGMNIVGNFVESAVAEASRGQRSR